MVSTDAPRFLSKVLWADAASCLATGTLQLAGGAPLAGLLNLPAPLLAATGVFMLGYGAIAAWSATRRPAPRRLVGLFAIGNVGWALGCMALLASGAVQPTLPGTAWVLAQAAAVVVLAALQWLGLRRRPVAAWA